jgi:hypothetical protein
MLVCGDGGEIIVVDGRVGVGKASTVNAVQYDKWRTEKLRSPCLIFYPYQWTNLSPFYIKNFTPVASSV